MLTRRTLLAAAPLLAFPAIIRANSWTTGTPFALGVASGDPASDGFVIWTRLAPEPFEPHGGMTPASYAVSWQVAEDRNFQTIAASGDAVALPELGHSVHAEVTGLKPDRPYWYRFTAGGERSMFGQAHTLPLAGSTPESLKFGVCGCQNYEHGFFTAYRHLAQEDLAFVFHYGDFIYERRQDYGADASGLPIPKPREHRLREVYSLDDYRAHYAQYLLDADLQSARSRHAFLSTFDDHEVDNNWAGNNGQDEGVAPEVFALRRQAAMQAWYEHMPVRRALLPNGPVVLANRSFAYGQLASLNLLDTRSFRTDQPCGDGLQPACAGVFDTAAQVLGAAQEDWLDRQLAGSRTAWNCLAQQVMMMDFDYRSLAGPGRSPNLDSWTGYDAPRNRMMARLARTANAVVLTGDVHQNYAGLLYDGDKAAGVEFVNTSITSNGDGEDLRPMTRGFLADNPQVKFANDQRGYSVCEVTPDAWQTHFMVMDKVSTPGGTLSKRATATVPRDTTELALS
jgi:alkaline phosphatase D